MKNFLKTFLIITLVALVGFSMIACSEPEPTGLAYSSINGGTAYSVSKGTVTSGAVVIPAAHEGKPVTAIADDAFEDADITGVSIPLSVTSIGSHAFAGCTNLTGITIPASVTSIGTAAFYGCTDLTDINIPVSVTSISDGMFNLCTSLTDLTIPVSITSIGVAAFQNCNFTDITIPLSVTSIEDWVFVGCNSLISVTFALGSNISDADFGENTFPEGDTFGNTLKTAYSTGKAGTYTRTANGDTWTKE